ncbi:hypothetical protein Hanom_Chr01g00015881 [Helianthus anomalus]
MNGSSRHRKDQWYVVPARKGRDDKNQDQRNKEVISKFFVSNLPPKASSEDLKHVLGVMPITSDHILQESLTG